MHSLCWGDVDRAVVIGTLLLWKTVSYSGQGFIANVPVNVPQDEGPSAHFAGGLTILLHRWLDRGEEWG